MSTVTVKSPLGQLGTIDNSELTEALKNGFTVAPNAEIDEHNNRIEHGSGVMNPLLAFAEEAASTATFGTSRQFENLTGLTTQEEQESRTKYNPIANMVGIPVGVLADPLGAVGLLTKAGKATSVATKAVLGGAPEGASLIAKAARNVPAAALGAAVEGAGFGIGQTIADQAMGRLNDPDLMAEHIAGNIGYGALFAGALGGALEGGVNVFGASTLPKMASFQADIGAGVAEAEAARAQSAARDAVMGEMEGPFGQFKAPPSSLDEIKQAVKTNFPVVPQGLPSHSALRESVEALPDLQFKPHALQYESLTDQGLRDYYKTFLESQADEGRALRSYEALQKSEATTKLDQTIRDLAPTHTVAKDVTSAGENVVKAFTDQYEKEQAALRPTFQKIDTILGKNSLQNRTLGYDALLKVEQSLGEDLHNILSFDKNGKGFLKPYEPTMALTKEAHSALKDLVKAQNKSSITASELRNLRDSMKGHIDFSSGRVNETTAQVSKIRKALMDVLQETVDKVAPDVQVRDAFKRYALNEEMRSDVERIVGGALSDKASWKKTIKPEEVLNKVFSSSVSVQAAKEILGDDFAKVMADYLALNRSKMTDEARIGFSSNKFKSFLKDKEPEILAGLNDPAVMKRLNALTDYMRILPDSPSSNPSGTAKSADILKRIAGISRSLKPSEAIVDFANKYMSKIDAEKQRFTLDQVLAGKHFHAAEEAAEQMQYATSKLKKLERFAENTAYRIRANAEAVFKKAMVLGERSVGILGSKLVPEPKKKLKRNDEEASIEKHEKVFAQIDELVRDPEKMISHLEKISDPVYHHAPDLAEGIQTLSVRALGFLQSKIPLKEPTSIFNQRQRYSGSPQEISKFDRYFTIVENPLLAFQQVKNRTITPETIETLSMVYPKLYDKMKLELLDVASHQKNVPFQTRQSVAMFLGEPLESSLSPANILANQAVFQANAQAEQAKNGQMKTNATNLAKLSPQGRMSLRANDEASV